MAVAVMAVAAMAVAVMAVAATLTCAALGSKPLAGSIWRSCAPRRRRLSWARDGRHRSRAR
jgi:hypothetical protein